MADGGFQPPLVVAVQLLISPVVEAGFPGTLGYGALAALFVCVLPLFLLLALVRLGKVTDHHVSNRKQRAPVLLMSLASVAAGLLVLEAVGAPCSVVVMVLAIVAGILVIAAVSPFWKISGHAHTVAQVVAGSLFGGLVMAGIWWLLRGWLAQPCTGRRAGVSKTSRRTAARPCRDPR